MQTPVPRWRLLFVAAIPLLLLPTAGHAQAATQEQLAKAAQNPIASLISVPIQNNTNFGIGPYDRTQNVTNVQPVVPVSLGGWNLINRFIAPLINQPDVTMESGSTFGLGDIVYEGFFTPASSGAVTWGIGPVLSLPTATDDALGTDQWSAGPAGILVIILGKFVTGATVYNVWSFAGSDSRPKVSQGVGQYFINYNLPNGWYLATSPIITVNWEATSGNQWTVPFGGGAGKIFAIGKQKMNAQVHAYWNAVKPEALDGPDWTLRLQLQFLFPK